MVSTDLIPERIRKIGQFLIDETRAYPGRANVMLRCVLASAIIVLASMTLQVPFLALSLVVVFFVTQSNVVMTRLIGVVFMIGSTLAIGSAILVLKLTYDYPLLRILMSAALFFASVWLIRVAKIGAAFFLVAIVVVYVQSYVDLTDQPEVLVRVALWVWVAVNYAIAVTLLINTLCLPAEPVRQLEDVMLKQLATIDVLLASFAHGGAQNSSLGAREVQAGVLTLQKLLRFATMRDSDYQRHRTFHLARVATVSRLLEGAAHLPDRPVEIATDAVPVLRDACARLADSIRSGGRFAMPEAASHVAGVSMPGALSDMRNALQALSERSAAPVVVEPAAEKERMLVPDAFSNPVYIQFALKTLLASMIGYLAYRATDWNGIHTIMLTCLIVAQPSLGALARRSILRIAGAALGSLIALAMAVWVVPRLDSIDGLLLMALPVLALGAWVTAGSERISYAGAQIMFTFALALLEQFGPTTNLTEIRDRMIGILLGVVISTVVHTSIWPEAEGEALRQRVGALLRRVASKLRNRDEEKSVTPGLWAELANCESMAALVALEPGWHLGEAQQEEFQLHVQTMLAQLREILLATDAFDAERRALTTTESTARRAAERAGEVACELLNNYAHELTACPEAVRAPSPVLPDSLAVTRAADEAESTVPASGDAYALVVVRARTLIERISTLPGWSVTSADTGITARASQA